MNGDKYRIKDLLEGDFEYTKIIIQYIFDYTQADIFNNRERIITDSELEEFMRIQKELSEGSPLQYAIGKWNFYGRDFTINSDVLIPRPETELLVDYVLKEELDNKKILDIGTGSGAIAISLALESKAHITASDISEKAIEIAKINSNNFGANIEFIQSDIFENIDEIFDYIVSNPPYLSEEEYDNVDALLYKEPKNALVGGKEGYEIYERIIKGAKKHLNNNGKIFLEIGYLQAEIVSDLLLENGYNNIKVIKDYNNLDRLMIGELCLNN